ncbi:hypothetical protein [Agrobacterium pusense]|uniref:hypothetical protein n=1 Tax=Agrobacterium pusense TaxID=648995 RepID=UPI000D39A012|nr:hypothetical protein [Agrobacterium pusense]PTV70248.1 hypothetical protein DBL06_25630 [Agrobacterium pusense]
MTTVAAHIADFIQEFADVAPAKPRNIKIDSFTAFEKAGARARKAHPDAPDFRKPPVAREIVLPKGIFVDPAKRIDLNEFDGMAW